jgi:hypothetical protein
MPPAHDGRPQGAHLTGHHPAVGGCSGDSGTTCLTGVREVSGPGRTRALQHKTERSPLGGSSDIRKGILIRRLRQQSSSASYIEKPNPTSPDRQRRAERRREAELVQMLRRG